MSKSWNGKADSWPQRIPPVRALLQQTSAPWVIENVEGAPLEDPVKLCGSSFGLDVRRHRLFEANFPIPQRACDHSWQTPRFPALRSGRSNLASVVGVYGTGGGDAKDLGMWARAMGIDWMATKHEMAESIPPAFTEFVGRALRLHLDTA